MTKQCSGISCDGEETQEQMMTKPFDFSAFAEWSADLSESESAI
jgi:hypothetical protein